MSDQPSLEELEGLGAAGASEDESTGIDGGDVTPDEDEYSETGANPLPPEGVVGVDVPPSVQPEASQDTAQSGGSDPVNPDPSYDVPEQGDAPESDYQSDFDPMDYEPGADAGSGSGPDGPHARREAQKRERFRRSGA